MRLRAVQRLANCNQGFSRDGLVKYLLIHLAVEESSKVVSAILTSFPAVVESSEFQEKIAEKFLKLVEDKWTHVQEKILRFSHELPASSLVRFLFPWNGERLKLFTALVENTKLLRLLGVESISQLEFEEANFPVIFKTVLDSAPAEFPLKPQSLGTPLTTPSEKLDVAIYLLFQVSQLRKIDLPPSEMGFSILQTLQAYVMGMRHAFNFACGTKTDLIKEEEFLENIHKIIGKCCVDDYVPMELVIFVVNSLAEEKSHDGRLISSSLLWLLELLTTQIGKSDSCTPSLMCLIKKLLNTSESPLQLILLALDISSTQTDPCGQAQHMLCRLFLQMLPTAIPADKNLACLAFMCVVSSLPMAIPSKKRSVLLKKTLEDLQDEHNVPSQSLRNVVHHINEGLDLASVLECPEYLAGFLEGHMSAEESSSTKRLSPSRRQTRQTQPEPSLMDLFLKLLHPDGEMKHLLNTKEAVLKLLSSVSYQELLETLLLDLGRDDTQKEMEVTSYQALILDHFIRSPPSIIFPSKSSSNLYQKFKSLLLNDEEASKYLLRRISSSYVSGLATVDLTEDFLNFLLDHAPVDVTDERSSTNSASRPSLPLVALKEVMRICKHINIDAAFLQKRFFKLVPSLQEAGSGRKRGRGLKRSTRTVTMVTANQSSSREWREISFILEILEGKKKIRQPTCLVGTLFEMLTKVLNWSEQEKCEYLKQLLLSSLHRCMSEREGSALGQSNEDPSMDSDDSDSDSSTGEESKSNPKLSSFDQGELLIQCLRSSSTSLVHHHTLRLLTLITKSSPQSVASSIIPIFTFIGTSLLKQDDAASLKLIEDTMQAVVPLLKKHEPGLGTETVCVNPKRPLTISLMRVFRNALPDIPTHRRLPLLEHLLQCLSPPRTRWILVTLLLEEQVRKQADKPKFFVDLALQLLLHGIDEGIDDPTSGVLECLETSKEVLQWLMALPLEVEQTQGKRRHKQAASESLLIDLESLEPTFLRQLQYQTLSLVVKVFCNSDFQGGLGAALETNERAERQSKDLNNLLMEMIKLLLDWSHTVSTRLKSRMGGNVEDSGMQKKFIQALFQRLYDLIHNLCLALPMNLFLQMVLGLLEDDKTDVVAQRKTLELLNTRLLGQEGPAVRRDEAWDEEVCLAFLPVLMRLMSLGKKTTRRVATGAGDQSGEKDRFELDCKLFVAQGSLFALKIFVKKFAASHTAQFSELVPRICKIVSQSSSTGCLPLLSSSVLALAYLAVELRFHAVTSLDVLMPTLLSTLAETDKIEKDPVLLLSCVTSLLRIVESLSAFIVPYLPGVLSLLTSLPQEQQPGDKPRRVINKIQKLRHLIATEIEPRVLLPVLRQTMIEEGHSVHTSILSEHINQMTKKEVADNFPLLTNLFLSLISAQPIKTFTEKESPFLAAVVALVLKLNEETFTLLLMKLINWAFTKAEEESSPEAPQKKKRKKLKERRLKCVAFFSITKKLSEELKSLFVGFASYFLSHVAETLADEQLNVDPTILDVTLITLQNLCRYDEDKSAIREEIVEPLTLSLMSCLRVIPIQDNMPGEYVKDVLNPTLSKFAAVLQSPQQKQFLLAVLANTKDESKEIRLATVGAMSDIFEELESACAQWLPEILPALSELLEDDEPDVEAAAQDVLVLLGKTTVVSKTTPNNELGQKNYVCLAVFVLAIDRGLIPGADYSKEFLHHGTWWRIASPAATAATGGGLAPCAESEGEKRLVSPEPPQSLLPRQPWESTVGEEVNPESIGREIVKS
ncbi:unnamed protein product [Cyprideis torosa]|uniref:HEAT repeat-containing protein 1 n=1 Tax=Cyprideis torosa TaxID=163714 RepID=A0A7R8WEU0_9CRUS|nr:unnamed protein product [Cyprideis torosa]CAG0894724.1 unnamed protein product [Cyprideis torosa]